MPFQQPLSPELEAEAQELVARLRPQAEEELLALARLLVSKQDRELFGQTEFEVRDIVPDRRGGARRRECRQSCFLHHNKNRRASPFGPARRRAFDLDQEQFHASPSQQAGGTAAHGVEPGLPHRVVGRLKRHRRVAHRASSARLAAPIATQ